MSEKNATGANEPVNAGQAVSDWAMVRLGKKWAENQFRDGSWTGESDRREEGCREDRSEVLFGVMAVAIFGMSITAVIILTMMLHGR